MISTTTVIGGLLLLHVVALHASIAAMEIVSWSIVVGVIVRLVVARRRPRFALLIPCAALTAIVGLSLLLAPPVKPFWIQFGFMRWTVLLWAFGEAFREVWTERFERRFVGTWVTVVLITGAYAGFQFLTGVDLFRARSHVDLQGQFFRATGFFSGSLTFAYVFGISGLSVLGPARRLFGRAAAAAVASSLTLGLVASYSRGSWVGVLVAGLVYVLLAHPRRVPFFLAASAVVAYGLSRVSPKFDELLHLRLEHSASVRTHLWRAYGQMVADHPWLGLGLFQTDTYLPTYYARLGIDETFASHAHNVPLQWAAGAGIFALALYVIICGYFARAAWRLRTASVWGWSLLTAQVFWATGSLTEANFFDGEVNHLIVFTWALLLGGPIAKAVRPSQTRA